MRKITRALDNISIFIRKNYTLTFILGLTVLIIVKFSALPAPSIFPKFLIFLLEKPRESTTEYKIFDLLNSLSLAYVASFIFYIVIDYLPKHQRERKAFTILSSNFSNIYISLEALIYMFLFELDVYKEASNINELDLF